MLWCCFEGIPKSRGSFLTPAGPLAVAQMAPPRQSGRSLSGTNLHTRETDTHSHEPRQPS
jgi:hypothetical protein